MTSWIATMLTSVVSLLSVISWDTVAGTIRRRPWGSTTKRIDWPVAHPQRARRLGLAAVERQDARAHDLGEDRRVVEHEAEDGGHHAPGLQALREPRGITSSHASRHELGIVSAR